jgi:hypothetical protein
MTKKKSTTKTKPQKYPISYGFHQYDDENMDGWGIPERVNQLIRQAKALPRRWDHLLLQVNEGTLVLVLVRAGDSGVSGSWGTTLVHAEFTNDTEKKLAVKALRREVGRWAKEHRLEPQPVKQLEEVKR